MGRPAGYRAGGDGYRFQRRQGANEDGPVTVRNLVPWHNVEKELAKRLAAKAARGELAEATEATPESGVRRSSPDDGGRLDEPVRPLTYSMYTVSELEARPPRPSMPAVALPPQPSRWADVWRSGLVVLRAFCSWARASKPRPRPMDVCQLPLIAFGADLSAVVRSMPWKKIGWASVLTFGGIALSLFAIVALAELTDDLKPRRISVRTSVQDSPPLAAEPVIELEDDPVPPPQVDAPAAKPAQKTPSKGRNAPEIFIP